MQHLSISFGPKNGSNITYLCYQFLVLHKPGLSHGSLSVKAASHLFKFFLPDKLISKHPFAFMFSPFQALPCLGERKISQILPHYCLKYIYLLSQNLEEAFYLVDVCHQCALFRGVNLLIVGPHPTLDCKEQYLQVSLLLESLR